MFTRYLGGQTAMEEFRFNGWLLLATNPCRGVAKLVKALDFDSSMRRFESFFPCQICCLGMSCSRMR